MGEVGYGNVEEKKEVEGEPEEATEEEKVVEEKPKKASK